MGVLQQAPSAGGAACLVAHADIIAALGALTECSSQLVHEPLKGTVEGATSALIGQIEGACRQLVEFLLSGLASQGDSDNVAYDKLWTLRLMGKRSEVTRRWILEAGGVTAVSRALAAHPAHEKLQKEGTWLVYVLGGIEGITELMRQNRGRPSVQEAAAWAIFEVGSGQKDRGQAGCAEWPQADTLVLLLLEAMRSQPAALALLWACCSALRVLLEAQPCRGHLFIEHGGDKAVLEALGAGQGAGAAGGSCLVAGMQLIAALVEGNSFAAQRLRAVGTLEGLVACGLSLPGKVANETMWTLGQIGGVMTVLQVMSRASDSKDAVRSGLMALAKLTWLEMEEGLQQQLPQAAEAALELARRVAAERPTGDVVYALQALGGLLHVLTPHVAPGSWPVADDGVALLINALGPSSDALVAQAAVASIGHIAARAPAWRKPLQGALGDIGRRMRIPAEKEDCMNHQKCLFWASASIAGLPVVLNEMRSQPSSPHVQDAAISAIIDLLDDHLDSPVLEGMSGGIESQHVPGAIETITGAMRLHRTHAPVQWGGCRALGLLGGALPEHEDVPADAVECVLAALRWHPDEHRVASSACGTFRSFLEPRRGRDSAASNTVVARAAATLRARDVGDSMRRILEQFGAARSSDKHLLEDALYTLGLTDGLPAALQALAASERDRVPLRSAGMQAIFEIGRTYTDLLAPPLSQEILAVASAIAREATPTASEAGTGPGDVDAEIVELLRRVELLHGLLGG